MNKRSSMEFLFDVLEHSVEACLFVGVIIMILVGMAQVIFRYVLQASLSWSEELMRFLYVWLTMFGTPLAIRRKQFTSIEILSDSLGNASIVLKRMLLCFLSTMQVFFFVLLIYFGVQLVSRNMHNTSPAMGISMGLAYCAIPIGGILGLLYCGITIWDMASKETRA